MSLLNKIALCGLALCLTLTPTGRVFAEESEQNEESSDANSVLFRIENIQPQKNSEGLVNKCKFLITTYNRMNSGVKSATLVFKWTDTISNKFKVEGGAVRTVEDTQAKTVITKEVTLDSLGAHKQRSFEEIVETDKCFLLFDSLDFVVKSCHLEDETSRRDSAGKGSCVDKFDYITTKNPEYYSEFKDVPDSVIERQVEDEKKQEVYKIDQTIENSLAELQEVSETLAKIK